jgi:hypothetical protein
MTDIAGDGAQTASTGLIKSQIDFGAGLLLIALAVVGFFGSLNLRFGSLTSVGPGLVPRSVAVLVGLFGIGLLISSCLAAGARVERWTLRGPFFLLGSVLVFAMTIRGSTLSLAGLTVTIPQLGLAIAGPLTVFVSALADKDLRPVELVLYTVVLTAACIGMFKFLLGLPIPLLPVGWGPY